MSELAEVKAVSLVETFSGKYGVDANKMLHTLKQTAFRGAQNITTEQLMALLVVANQYDLNPFTKEIYAFPDKGAIIPVVSVDGWSRIMNSNPQMDGIEFEYSPETVEHKGKVCHVWIECSIYRKDRSRPIKVREFFDEVVRNSNQGPWVSHPNRMHRHKTEIQCARVAFGFAGIYDADEAERIAETSNVVDITPPLPTCNDEQKAYYHQLIADNNAIEFYVYMTTLPESVRNDLHNSFEKGEKTRGKATANDLYGAGRTEFEDYITLFGDAMTDNDTLAIGENAADLSDEVMAFIGKELGDDFINLVSELKESE